MIPCYLFSLPQLNCIFLFFHRSFQSSRPFYRFLFFVTIYFFTRFWLFFETLITMYFYFFSPGLPDGPLPSSIGSLTKLQFLDFSGNGFTGTIPPQFSQLTQAWKLSLSSNALHGNYACYSFSFSIILHFNLFINYYYGTCFIV